MLHWDYFMRRRRIKLNSWIKALGLKTVTEVKDKFISLEVQPPTDIEISKVLKEVYPQPILKDVPKTTRKPRRKRSTKVKT